MVIIEVNKILKGSSHDYFYWIHRPRNRKSLWHLDQSHRRKLAWIPKKKIEKETRAELAAVVVMAGETIQRKVWLTDLEIDTEWFNKVLA